MNHWLSSTVLLKLHKYILSVKICDVSFKIYFKSIAWYTSIIRHSLNQSLHKSTYFRYALLQTQTLFNPCPQTRTSESSKTTWLNCAEVYINLMKLDLRVNRKTITAWSSFNRIKMDQLWTQLFAWCWLDFEYCRHIRF